ncbi:hypothetical protein [Bartonella sp. CB175]|uniref:hypothetical protein n=1 Tax=Bartonella sp. CB175 TaxID=3112256 RepID=UPI00300DDE33
MKLSINLKLTIFFMMIVCTSFIIADSIGREINSLYCQIPNYTFTKNITKPGHNSFTASQIKTYLTRSGFKDIKRLRLDDKGIWRALVEFKKCHFFISIDYSGTINIKNESKKYDLF